MARVPIRVLIIEDNPGDVRLIRAMLAEIDEFEASVRASIRSEESSWLAQGIDLLRVESFDLVLLDLGLPDSQGVDGVLRLTAEFPELPIVVMSGGDDGATAIKAVHEGAQDYLVKGHVDPDALHRAIRYAIERKRVDIERVHLLAAEQEARVAAEAALRTRDQVLGTVSHDLRTPIAAIGFYAKALQASASRPESVTQQALRIERAARDALEMIQELLDVARLGMGQTIDLDLGLVDLAALVRGAVDEQRERDDSHQFEISAPHEVWGRWDAPRIRRVATNLLSNASKYSAPGTTVWLDVMEEPGDGEVIAILRVRDQGLGIPAAEVPKLFDWYYRASNVGARKGTGIGLAGSQRIVALHGGHIKVETSEGAGSTFTVYLPIGP